MKVELSLDQTLREPKIVILAPELTEEVRHMAERLGEEFSEQINGYREDGMIERIRCAEILRIYTEGQRVICETAEGRFFLKKRIYELEELLREGFVRISNSEIVNIRKILRLDAGITGTIGVSLEGGVKTYASRRYVPKIRAKLGL